ncbi:protein nervous wreck-like isoform X3 [Daphnia pulicaria]|uniref:protein nervous wreck-like isoform X3 n=1 Tax=Daphnia pulicaria TaxID=35523 RepID=UPI001EEB3C6A|nr:protein nervous wreck-like isoform X3 [Daphnia pulicaria]
MSTTQQQPPPRKVLRNLHAEQLSKVQWKHQQECELLEDLRNFIKQRCAVEKSYGEAMQKISANYLNKKMPPIHELNHDEINQQWTVWSIWRSLLEETDKLAKAKLAAVEIFQTQIADDVKIVRQNKLQLAKKNLDLLKVVQGEVQTCVTELDKLKKVYVDDEHVSHDARDKAREAEEKLKKKKGSIFQSVSSLQKTSAKLGSRRDLCEEKSTQARNAYLLQLASANAHQNRYFHVDLQNVVKTLDGGMYEKVAEYFSIMSRTELYTCSASQFSFGKIKEQAQTINRDYDLACFVDAFPILNQHITYDFEPCDNDVITTVDQAHGAGAGLIQSGKQYASRVAQESKKIRESTRTLQTLQGMKESGLKSDPNEPNGPDIDAKIDEIKNQLRRSETAKIKAEARLECLHAGGVKVDEFLQDAEGLVTLGLMRSSSQLSFRESAHEESEFSDSGSRAGAETTQQDEEEEEAADEAFVEQVVQQQIAEMQATWQDPTAAWDTTDAWGDDAAQLNTSAANTTTTSVQIETASSVTDSVHASGDASVIKCIAFYPYTAQNADELSMMENEELEVLLAFSEGDGWVKARNYKGEEGYVPENYLDLHADDQVPCGGDEDANQNVHQHPAIAEEVEPEEGHEEEEEEIVSAEAEGGYPLENQISFSSVDYTYQQQGMSAEEEDEFPGPTESAPLPPPPPPIAAPVVESSPVPVADGQTNRIIGYCRAMYDYDATSDEELTFYEGEVIAIFRRSGALHDQDVDDGWWEGQLLTDGTRGVFPSLVVEECGPNGEELTPKVSPATPEEESVPPPGSPPVVPTFLLPPERVIITQPTPETEFPDDHVEHMFDQNATIKEMDEDEDDLASEMINVEPATPTEEEGNNNGQITDGLPGTQIIVTASTPMVENEFKCFDPTDEKTSDDKENGMEQEFGEEMEPPPPPAPEPSTTETSSSSLDQPLPPPAPIADETVVSKGFDDEFVQLETAKESYA